MKRTHKRPFTSRDMISGRTADSFTVSADGKVAFAVSEPSEDLTKVMTRVWVLDESAPEGARPVTSLEHKAAQPRFSPDGRTLAYLSEAKDGVMQLAVLAGLAEPRLLTKFARGVDTFMWAPSGRELLILAAPDPSAARKKAIELKDDAHDVDADAPVSRMWLIGARGGKPRPVGPSNKHVIRIAWSPDGGKICFLAADGPHTDSPLKGIDVRIMNARGRGARTVMRMQGLDSPGVYGATPRFSPDGTRIALNYSGDKGQLGPDFIHVVSCADGKARVLDRATDQRSVLPRWLDDDAVVFFQQRGARRVLRRASASGRAADTLVDLPGFIYDCEVAPGGEKVFFSYMESGEPLEVYSVDVDGGKPKRLTRLNARFDRVCHAPLELVGWKSREGWEVEGLLYRPTAGRAPYATVVIPHGGPHGAVNNAHDPVAQVYAAKGYAVFMPNFRGSIGYGTRAYRAIHGNWGNGPADDVMRGVKALVKGGVADPKRLVIHGGSYGGYLTAWIIGHYREFRAAIALAPVMNGLSMWGTTDIPTFMDWSLDAGPKDRYEAFWRQSPVAYLHRVTTPTLVVTGEKDVRVPVGQSQELYQGLKAAGVETALVMYPREGHGVAEPRHRLDYMRRCLEWFGKHLGKDAPKGNV